MWYITYFCRGVNHEEEAAKETRRRRKRLYTKNGGKVGERRQTAQTAVTTTTCHTKLFNFAEMQLCFVFVFNIAKTLVEENVCCQVKLS